MRNLTIIALAIIVALTTTTATAQSSQCDGLDEYQMAVFSAVPYRDLETLIDILDQDMDRVRPSEFAEAATILDDWATALDAMPSREIPPAARAYHSAFIDYLGVTSAVMSAMATGNLFGALAYVDVIDEVGMELDAADRAGARTCGSDWPFSDQGTVL